jgi:hypothetical protein
MQTPPQDANAAFVHAQHIFVFQHDPPVIGLG